jgi:periplasmic divalent cation tolerance protein
MSELRLVITTFPNQEKAREISKQMVEQSLAACANLLPGVQSIYQWQGKLCEESEVMAWFKTSARTCATLMLALKQAHPYEVPEILLLHPEQVDAAYAAWVLEHTTPRL